jgi:hypothetical protein
MLNVSTMPSALRCETQRLTRSRVTLLRRMIDFQIPLLPVPLCVSRREPPLTRPSLLVRNATSSEDLAVENH